MLAAIRPTMAAHEHAAAVDALHRATAIYTREPVVRELLAELAWPQGLDRNLVDTSCGDGAFLGAALERLFQSHPQVTDAQVACLLHGWEIHPEAAALARERLTAILFTHGRSVPQARALAERIVRCADFLVSGPTTPTYDVIAGNPPYLRMPNVPVALRQEYEALLPDYAQADLLHSFLDRCAAVLRADGRLGMVTADRWLFNAGAARLREVIGATLGIARVTRLTSASAFYRPKARRAGSPPRVHPVVVVLKHREDAERPLTAQAIFPGDYQAPDAGHLGTLADVAHVRLAPWLGTPGIFLIDEQQARGIPAAHLVPAIDTHDVRAGRLGRPSRFAILTQPGQQPPEAIVRHLEREMPRMCERGRARAESFLPPESFHHMDLSEPMLLVPRIAKSLRPVRVPAGMLPVNHNLTIVRSGRMSLDEIEAMLCSPQAQDWVAHHAAPLEDGYYSITTRLLRSLPVFEPMQAAA